jgi:hypothetical protein
MSTSIQISSGGGNVDYSNVAWVDAINGSDLTGAIGDFTKPFATAAQAVNTANSFGFTANNRGLVYVRRGQYSDQIGLLPNIDFYCEPGTVWIAGGFVDTATTGSVGIYGSAKFVTDARALLASYSSTIYMEFDEINQNTNLSIAQKGGLASVASQSKKKRSKNEIYFYELCKDKFNKVLSNEPMFNGWDADVIIEDIKTAILWNGKWHYEKIKKEHSVEQVQNRDKIKLMEIENMGYKSYVIKDLGKANKEFVEKEFKKFIDNL